MIHLIQNAIAYAKYLFSGFALKQVLAIVFTGFLVLTTSVDAGQFRDAGQSSPELSRRIDRVLEKGNAERPTTTGEWKQEARETEGETGEKIKRIGKEAKEAVKEWGGLYSDTAKRSADSLKDALQNNDAR
jgi:hypothetical protein